MSDVSVLLERIDAEFSALEGKIKRAQDERLQEHQERQNRLTTFKRELDSLPEVWGPRLDALMERFGDYAKVAPRLESTSRAVTMDFETELARIRLRLSATTDHDVRNLILSYDLEILPALMQFDSHQQGQWPIHAIDREAIGAWVDDRIVSFVKTYLSLHENEYYLKEHMVLDPVAGVRFPSYAAAATVDVGGKTYYFIGDETRREFEAKQGDVSSGLT
jgi:YHS domain-containing protein